MRLLRLFRPRSASDPSGRRFAVDRLRIFDHAKTDALRTQLAVPRGRRDAAWSEAFFDAVWNAALVVADPAVITGPDGFPYLRVNLPEARRFKEASVSNLAQICLDRATGIALFASANDPVEASQYVFPPGMLDCLLRYDTWLGDPMDLREAPDAAESLEDGWGRTEVVTDARQVMLGSPAVQYLPIYTARALLNHMRGAWGIADPRVRLMVDPALRPSRNLVVGRKRSELNPATPWAVQCSRLLWLLPKGRSIMLMPEDWRLEDMTPLEQLAGQVPGPSR